MVEHSGRAIIELRERYATKQVDLVISLISELGDKTCLGGAVFFSVHWLGKTEAFTVMTAFSLSVTVLGFSKLYF